MVGLGEGVGGGVGIMSLCVGLLPFCHAALASPRLPSPGHLPRLCGKSLGGLASQLVVVSVG